MPYVEGTTTETTAPAEHWRRAVEKITESAREILKAVEEARRIYKGNRLATLIGATPAGQAVPGTAMSREQAEAYAGMIAAVAGFMDQEIAAGFTIEDGLYAMWAAPVAPPEA